MGRIAARDESALGTLYDVAAPRLLALAAQILPGRQEAAAAVDEVFVKLVVESARLAREHVSVLAWLTLVLRQTAVARLRARLRLPPPPGGGALPKSLAWLPGPAEVGLLDQRRGLLTKVLNQLPPHQIEVLELAVFGGRKEEEICRELGEPLGQAKSELRAALSFLRHRWRTVMGLWTANI